MLSVSRRPLVAAAPDFVVVARSAAFRVRDDAVPRRVGRGGDPLAGR
jgi:hypothetical protein